MHMSRQPIGIHNIPFCRLRALLLLALLAPVVSAEIGLRDPEFSRVPFEQWLTAGKQSRIHWSVEVVPAELSTHQRLIERVILRMDGRELEKRHGAGRFLALAQFEDSEGRLWQNHQIIDVSSVAASADSRSLRSQEIAVAFYALMLPGDYELSVALCDPSTLEHSFTRRRVHIGALKTDPLPAAWSGLPQVEFISGSMEPPDVWFLPGVRSRLRMPLATERRVHLEVLVNTTPSERALGSLTALRRNMSVLIPALKVLSQLDLRNGSLDVALLDLIHRRVTFEQKAVHELNWEAMRRIFAEINPGVVDVRTLAGQWKMRRFFSDEVNRRLSADEDAARIVVILSGPAFLDDQEPVEPVCHGKGEQRLFYIRYRTPPPRPARLRPHPGVRPASPIPAIFPMPVDDLQRTVEPLNARLFDATSAEQFRRILAAVIDQIGKL